MVRCEGNQLSFWNASVRSSYFGECIHWLKSTVLLFVDERCWITPHPLKAWKDCRARAMLSPMCWQQLLMLMTLQKLPVYLLDEYQKWCLLLWSNLLGKGSGQLVTWWLTWPHSHSRGTGISKISSCTNIIASCCWIRLDQTKSVYNIHRFGLIQFEG